MLTLQLPLYIALNAGASPNGVILHIARWVATYPIYSVPVLLSLDWLTGSTGRRVDATTVCLAVLAGLAINQLISFVLYVPRPFEIGLGSSYLQHAVDSSFPSDHATVLFTAAVVYAMRFRVLWSMLLVITGLSVGWARIYCGVHYPADIAGAALVALAAGVPTVAASTRWGNRLVTLAESAYRLVLAPLIARGWIRR